MVSGCIGFMVLLSLAGQVDVPWYQRCLVGMEVGPTGAQFGCDPADVRYASKFSGKEITEKAAAIGCQYVVIWGKDSEFAYYDSKVAPKCPGLGGRDVVRETVEAAKPHGLPVIVYVVVQGNGYPLRDHPEYKMVGFDGKPIDRVCLNAGFMAHLKDVVDELLAYGIDGFHIDMLDQGFGPPYGCWCPACRAKFEADYHAPMPTGVTWDEAWDRMMEFRYNTSVRFEKEIYDHIKAKGPRVAVDFNYHGTPPFSWELGQRPVQHAHVGDFVTGECGVWGFGMQQTSFNALMAASTDPNGFAQVVMQRGVKWYHDNTTRPVNDMKWEMMALLMHGVQVTIVDKLPYEGAIDQVAYDRYGEVFSEVHAKSAHFGHAHRPLPEVGLYYSSRTRDWYGRENAPSYQQPFLGAHKALVYEHIPMGILFDENASVDKLRQFPVVYLPHTCILSEKEVAMLRDYVAEGGNVILSGFAGLYGHRGEQLDRSMLEELIGATLVEKLPDIDNHVALETPPAGMEALANDIPQNWPFLVRGPAVAYKPTTAIPYGSLYKPCRTIRQQKGLEGTDLPNSPDTVVGPAMLINAIGKGKVLCLCCGPDAAFAGEYRMSETRLLIRNAVRFLNPAPPLEVHAPLYVESVITAGPEPGVRRVHFMGYISPGACTPGKDRPLILPSLMEDVPLYRASIKVRGPINEVIPANPKTQVKVNGDTIEALIEDIHEVLFIR